MAKPSLPGTSMFRRHPILTAMALLATVCLAAACIFLATFDLNTYRESLASRLSTALAQPVSIGSASMSWRRGPAFDISALRIGAPDAEPIGKIEHLFLQPRLLPLLRGKVVFNDMILDHPRYKLDLLPSDSTTELPISLLKALLQTVQVRNLEVIDGHLDLDDYRAADSPAHVQVRAIELKIRNLLTGRPGKLQLSAELLQNQEIATLSVKGRISQDSDMSNWRQTRGNLQLQLENIAAEQISTWLPPSPGSPKLSGKSTLTLTTEGSVVDGLHFNAGLSGPDLTLVWPSRYQTSPPINNFAVTGTWTGSESLDTLSELNLQLNRLFLQGHLSLQHGQDQPWLEGTLSSQALNLADIREFVPDRVRLSNGKILDASLEQGTMQIHHLRLAGPLQHLGQTSTLLPILDARITLSDARLPLSAASLEQLNAAVTLRGGDLHLNEGTALLMKSPVRFSGTTTHLLKEDQIFSFSAEWDAPANRLWNDLATPRAWHGKAHGIIPITVSLTGPFGQLHGNLHANLGSCVFDWPGIISKPAGSPAELRLSGHQKDKTLIIEEGLFSLSPCDLQLTGTLGLTDKFPLDLRLKLPPMDLQKAAQLTPVLATYQPEGTLAFDGQLSGPLAKPSITGQARLNAGALAIDALEAEARDINGTITISDQQCRFTGLHARLGQSPLRLDGTLLSGETGSVFTLHFKAPEVAAGEIIFPGSKVTFRNLDGTLVFNRDRIRYENIHFDLGTGKGFKLEGSQGISDPILAELNIHAKKASIDEVLALWDEEISAEIEAEAESNHYRIVIQAGVDEGRYGNLTFSEAKGVVIAENNTVTISPLAFLTGSGSCQGEVIIDNSDVNQSMLAISGQMKDIDAAHMHNELLRHQGLVTGKLNGQVQLQGPAGPELLTKGKGKADIHVKDGVLRKFSFLSKVFSLLNVSQIFTFHLPDMASHGMPFTSLDGSFNLGEGRLTTEDLAVASNAMNLSLVGSFDLKQDQLDLLMGIKPFGTVDKIVSKIPLAGWILTGENKSLITAHFRIQGPSEAPEVDAIPITSVSEKVFGIFQRVLGLPGKVVSDVGELLQGGEKPEDQTGQPTSTSTDQEAEAGRAPQ